MLISQGQIIIYILENATSCLIRWFSQLLSLWESKIKLEPMIVDQLRVPVQSWREFEKALVSDFPQVVATINSHIDSTFEVFNYFLFISLMLL